MPWLSFGYRFFFSAALLAFLMVFPLTATAQNIITTVAGGGANSSVATSAVVPSPTSVALDTGGNIYIASPPMYQIFRVDPAGNFMVVAGSGTSNFSGDGGPATNASLNEPWGVAVDGPSNLFIADRDNNRIRRVDASTGIITTVAGNGTYGFSGDGGPATSASLANPLGLAVDAAGNLFIADTFNERVRRVDASTGVITTVAGSGIKGFSGDGGPAIDASLNWPQGVTLDSSGNLFIPDYANTRIRKVDAVTGIITTVAGNGTYGFSGDGGPATDASLSLPCGVAVDASGNLFVADYTSQRVRRVDASTGIITTVAGNGSAGFSGDGGPATSASLASPLGATVDGSGNLFIADFRNNRIRRVGAAAGIITTVAGSGSDGDGGKATGAMLVLPSRVAEDASGNLFIADPYNSRVRRVDASTGIITTVAGNGTHGFSGDGGPATSASLSGPFDIALDGSGNLFIADGDNSRIRRVDISGTITTVAGGGSGGSVDGVLATDASLSLPWGVAVDSSGNLFIANTGSSCIRRVDAVTGIITTVAGNGTYGFSGDGGPATDANLSFPYGVAVDGSGNLFIADSDNQRVRRVDASTGIITTVAGNGTYGFSGDGGPAGNATLNWPWGVATDGAGNLFIADSYDGRIRRVDASTGIIITVAGNGITGYSGDGGPATGASLYDPWGVAVGSSGNLFIADTSNNRVREVVLAPVVTLSTTSLSFSAQPMGTTSPAQTVTVTNSGGTNLRISSILASAGFGQSNNCPVSTATLNPGSTCTISVTFAPTTEGALTGTVTITDNASDSPQSIVLTGTGTGVVTTTSIVAPSITYGSAARVTVSVTSGQATVAGNVSLTVDNSSPLSQPLSGGSTVFTISGLTGGSHSLSASYAAQGTFAASSATGTLQVNKANTTTTITTKRPNPSVAGQLVMVNFRVASVRGGIGTPTGKVVVSDGSGDACTATVATGTCSLVIPAAGTKTLTAGYAGDGNFNSSTSPAVTQNVTDFSISASPASQSIKAGRNAGYAVTLTPLSGFSGTVSLSCTALPPGTTCSFARNPIAVTGSRSVNDTVTVRTSRSTPTGTYTLTFTGIFRSGAPATGGLTHLANASLTVQ